MKTTIEKIDFVPYMALVFYEATRGERSYYIESHNIGLLNEKFVMGAGKPLEKDELNKLVDYYKEKKKEEKIKLKAILPPNVLYYDDKSIIWYRKAERTTMYFTKNLEIGEQGEADTPNLIFKATSDNLYVWAYKDKDRPNDTTELYHCPFHNVYSDGRICLGNTYTAKKSQINTLPLMISYWEKIWWGTKFSEIHNQKSINGNLNLLWKSLLNTDKKFPEKVLIKTGKKLCQII